MLAHTLEFYTVRVQVVSGTMEFQCYVSRWVLDGAVTVMLLRPTAHIWATVLKFPPLHTMAAWRVWWGMEEAAQWPTPLGFCHPHWKPVASSQLQLGPSGEWRRGRKLFQSDSLYLSLSASIFLSAFHINKIYFLNSFFGAKQFEIHAWGALKKFMKTV